MSDVVPIGLAVVAIDVAPEVRVGGPRRLVTAVGRATLQLLAGDIHHVATKPSVVGEHAPGQWVVAFSNAKEAAEAHHCVSDLPAELVNHDVVNGAEAVALPVVDRGALDLVGGDQPVRLVNRDAAVAATCGGRCCSA